MDSHDYLDDLVHFSHVVAAGGFTAASERYGIPKSRLSRRIQRLEQRFGCALIHRSNRQFTLTAVGARIYGHCQAILTEAERALAQAHAVVDEPQGELRICCPVVITQTIIGRMAAKFAQQNPNIRIVLEASNRMPDPISEGYDFVIRPTPKGLSDSGLIARKIGVGQFLMVGHPDLLAANAKDHPGPLEHLPIIAYGTTSAPQKLALTGPGGTKHTLRFSPAFVSDNLIALKEAVLAKVGVAALPDIICQTEIEEGRLAACCPEWRPPPMVFYVLYPSRLSLTAAAKSFLAFLHNGLQKKLDIAPLS